MTRVAGAALAALLLLQTAWYFEPFASLHARGLRSALTIAAVVAVFHAPRGSSGKANAQSARMRWAGRILSWNALGHFSLYALTTMGLRVYFHQEQLATLVVMSFAAWSVFPWLRDRG